MNFLTSEFVSEIIVVNYIKSVKFEIKYVENNFFGRTNFSNFNFYQTN